MWGIFLTTSNTVFQMATLMNQSKTSDEAVRMAKVYMVGSLISYISIILFFKGKLDVSYWLTLYYTVRNAIRLMDFEKTRDLITDEEWL